MPAEQFVADILRSSTLDVLTTHAPSPAGFALRPTCPHESPYASTTVLLRAIMSTDVDVLATRHLCWEARGSERSHDGVKIGESVYPSAGWRYQ